MPASKRKRASERGSDVDVFYFPFPAGIGDTDLASEGLKELLGGASPFLNSVVPFGNDTKPVVKTSDGEEGIGPASSSDDAKTSVNDKADSSKKVIHRVNFLKIGEEENKCLEPKGWLNDTLIDFWNHWYVVCKMLHICACMSHTV
jgi:hypothetical protein